MLKVNYLKHNANIVKWKVKDPFTTKGDATKGLGGEHWPRAGAVCSRRNKIGDRGWNGREDLQPRLSAGAKNPPLRPSKTHFRFNKVSLTTAITLKCACFCVSVCVSVARVLDRGRASCQNRSTTPYRSSRACVPEKSRVPVVSTNRGWWAVWDGGCGQTEIEPRVLMA